MELVAKASPTVFVGSPPAGIAEICDNLFYDPQNWNHDKLNTFLTSALKSLSGISFPDRRYMLIKDFISTSDHYPLKKKYGTLNEARGESFYAPFMVEHECFRLATTDLFPIIFVNQERNDRLRLFVRHAISSYGKRQYNGVPSDEYIRDRVELIMTSDAVVGLANANDDDWVAGCGNIRRLIIAQIEILNSSRPRLLFRENDYAFLVVLERTTTNMFGKVRVSNAYLLGLGIKISSVVIRSLYNTGPGINSIIVRMMAIICLWASGARHQIEVLKPDQPDLIGQVVANLHNISALSREEQELFRRVLEAIVVVSNNNGSPITRTVLVARVLATLGKAMSPKALVMTSLNGSVSAITAPYSRGRGMISNWSIITTNLDTLAATFLTDMLLYRTEPTQ